MGEDGQQVEEWLELSNGCICCSIKYLTPSHINYSQIRADVLRDSGVAAIESLISRSGAFDYVILETSGLADPGNLAPLFWVDEGLGSSIYLDGIVTLVDVKNILLSLNEIPLENEHDSHKGPYMTTAHLQISHADIILLNKSDTITAEQLEAVEDRVRGINGLAKMYITNYSQVPRLEGFLLDLHAYDGLDALNISSKGHSHLDPVSHQFLATYLHNTNSEKTISTFSLPVPLLSTEQLLSLETWLQSLLWESILPLPATQSTNQPNFSIHRLKGRVSSVSGETKMIQGVRDVFEMVSFDPAKSSGQARNGKYDRGEDKIVLIGRGLADLPLESSLRFSLNQSASDSSA